MNLIFLGETMNEKSNKKYINTLDELKIESFKGDNYVFELNPDILNNANNDLSSDQYCLNLISKQNEKKLSGFSAFFIIDSGFKLYFLVKDNIVWERHFFQNQYGKKQYRKTSDVYSIEYDTYSNNWNQKSLHDKKNRPNRIHKKYWMYTICYDFRKNKIPVSSIDVSEYGSVIDIEFYSKTNGRFYNLSELKREYPELSGFNLNVKSIEKLSISNKKIKDLYALIEMILI